MWWKCAIKTALESRSTITVGLMNSEIEISSEIPATQNAQLILKA